MCHRPRHLVGAVAPFQSVRRFIPLPLLSLKSTELSSLVLPGGSPAACGLRCSGVRALRTQKPLRLSSLRNVLFRMAVALPRERVAFLVWDAAMSFHSNRGDRL